MTGRPFGRIKLNDVMVADETRDFSFLIDAAEITLNENSDGTSSSWIQAMPVKKYDHPLWGTLDFTDTKVKEFADNVNGSVRGTELDVDYEHKEGPDGGKAAGWIKKAEARLKESPKKKNGLWILVEWTKEATKRLKEKEYKYFSPEFDWEWVHPQSGKKFTNVLFGGALTNRPFLKDLLPINLSEMGFKLEELFKTPTGKFSQEDAHYREAMNSMRRCTNCAFFRSGSCLIVDGKIEGDHVSDHFQAIYAHNGALLFDEQGNPKKLEEEEVEELDPKELRKALGLAEDASDDDVKAAIKKLTENDPLKGIRETLGLSESDDEAKILSEIKTLSERPEPGSEDPRVKKLEEIDPDAAKLLRETAQELRESRADKVLTDWESGQFKADDGKVIKRGLPPRLHDDTKALLLSLPETATKKFTELVNKLITIGLVDYSERGSTRLQEGEDGEEKDERPSAQFAAKLKEEIEAGKSENNGNGIALNEAIKRTTNKHPKLAEAWRKDRKTKGSESEEEVG